MDIYTTDKIATIYRATNTINGKVYIGFDTDWPRRKYCHKSHHQGVDDTIKFYRAIRKYGWEAFVWDVIYQSKEIEHTLKVMEPFFIGEHDSKKNGYNSTEGGDGTVGLKHSDSTKKRLAVQFGKKCKGPDGTIYFSANEASIQTGISYGAIKYRCRKNILGWSYLDCPTNYRPTKNYAPTMHKNYDHNVYEFFHDTGIVEKCQRYELLIKYDLNQGNLSQLVRGLKLVYRGWRLSRVQCQNPNTQSE